MPLIIQIKACRMFGAKALCDEALAYFQVDTWEQTWVKIDLK